MLLLTGSLILKIRSVVDVNSVDKQKAHVNLSLRIQVLTTSKTVTAPNDNLDETLWKIQEAKDRERAEATSTRFGTNRTNKTTPTASKVGSPAMIQVIVNPVAPKVDTKEGLGMVN